jgi:nucleotidyltransferase substrate binding protein (TIGR01987 family)
VTLSDDKWKQSVADLEHALDFEDRIAEDHFYFAGIAKSFEICFEYTWKALKRRAIDEGLEIYSPRETLKAAGRLGLIEDVEQWLGFLHDRNLAMHNYLGLEDKDYLETIKAFLIQAKKLSR